MYVEYDTNNSGGSWWLKTADWQALENAGWIIHWIHELIPVYDKDGLKCYVDDVDNPSHTHYPSEDYDYDLKWGNHKHKYSDPLVPSTWSGGDWMGAAATSAAKVVANSDEAFAAVGEFERITKQRASDEGCNCCGPPHSFTLVDDEGNSKYFSSKPVIERYDQGWY